MSWVIVVVILLTTILDAFRDRWLPKVCRGEDWLMWHLVKWGAFFLPLGLLSYYWLSAYHFQTVYIIGFAIFAVLCKIVWRLIYNYKGASQKKV
jgi:hypothetical protein